MAGANRTRFRVFKKRIDESVAFGDAGRSRLPQLQLDHLVAAPAGIRTYAELPVITSSGRLRGGAV